MDLLNKVIPFLFLGLFSCAKNLPYELKAANNGVTTLGQGEFVSTSIESLDGQQSVLAAPTADFRVLILSGDSCVICGKEADAMRDYIGNSPLKIELHTILVGAYPEDGIAWRDRHAVTWPVFVSDDVSATKRYCGKPQVPCVIIESKTKGIVFTHLGEVSIAELEGITGSWK